MIGLLINLLVLLVILAIVYAIAQIIISLLGVPGPWLRIVQAVLLLVVLIWLLEWFSGGGASVRFYRY